MRALLPLAAVVSLTTAIPLAAGHAVAAHSFSTTARTPIAHVSIVGNGRYRFQPAKISVKVGTTVIWTNHTNAQHTVTDENGKWSSLNFGNHHSYKHRFTKAGAYHYVCALHGYMSGTVVVRK